ncbi:MAG TPA: hypothetical protein VK827_01895 [Lysobacter sp.]|nr:hypothetical protein [Lysobacter sp.]
MKFNRLSLRVAGAAALFTVALSATASHSWNNYHWARTAQNFPLQVVDSTTPDWDGELAQTLSDWSKSTAFDLAVTSSDDSARTRKRCAAVSGQIRVCNAAYGNNGWLGLASINIDSNGHITRGTAKVNDSYSSYFAIQDERDHVMCQEVGHLFGLGHTSENGSSQNTCMDYSQSPNSTRPNAHDYAQLETIYSHLDSYNTYAIGSSGGGGNGKGNGKPMAGQVPMGMRIRKGVFDEVWAAPDGAGGVWIHHVTLAPGFEHTELLD